LTKWGILDVKIEMGKYSVGEGLFISGMKKILITLNKHFEGLISGDNKKPLAPKKQKPKPKQTKPNQKKKAKIILFGWPCLLPRQEGHCA